jgi:hypothetical protein
MLLIGLVLLALGFVIPLGLAEYGLVFIGLALLIVGLIQEAIAVLQRP